MDFTRPGFEFAKDSRGYPIAAGMPGRPDESGVLAKVGVFGVDLLLLYFGIGEFVLIGEATSLGSAFLTSTGVAAGIIKTEADLIAWNEAANEAIKQVANGLSPAGALAQIIGGSIFGREYAASFGDVGSSLQSAGTSLISSEDTLAQRVLELKELFDSVEKLKERLKKELEITTGKSTSTSSATNNKKGSGGSEAIQRPGGPSDGSDENQSDKTDEGDEE